MNHHFLRPLFSPKSVVVFSDSSKIKPADSSNKSGVDPERNAYGESIVFADMNDQLVCAEKQNFALDLCIIDLPQNDIASALELIAQRNGTIAIIVNSALDADAKARLQDIAQLAGIALVLPNTLCLQRPSLHLKVGDGLGPLATKGTVALVSQSTALTAAMLDWAASNDVGFSSVVSLGADNNIDVAQVLDFLASDEQTQSIVIYLESVKRSRTFMSALRSLAFLKTVIILKSGRDFAGNSAAQTHSGVMTSSDSVFDAAIARAGAIRVNSFVELFSAAKCLASRYHAVGNRLGVVCNGAGLGMLAADWISTIGMRLGVLHSTTAQDLQQILPKESRLEGCIDLTQGACEHHYVHALAAANDDAQIDGVLLIYAPCSPSIANRTAELIVSKKPTFNKPVLTCWMGDSTMSEARRILTSAGIPSFRTPESAVGAFGNIAAFYENQQLLQQTPAHQTEGTKADVQSARLIIQGVLDEGRTALSEIESKSLLAAFHIPVTQTVLARTASEALLFATQIGFPVALKIESPDVLHKSDVQGVALNVSSGESARDTFSDMILTVKRLQPNARVNGITVQKMAHAKRGREVHVGVVTDAVFGPIIQFGAGGTMVELINDRAIELPPLNQFLTKRLISRTRVAKTLGSWQGNQEINREALEQILMRVSDMVCALPQLREMDINPIIIDEIGAVAVDARIMVRQSKNTAKKAFEHLAIEPYPVYLKQGWPLVETNGGDREYFIRPIRSDDADMLQELVKSLSPEAAYFRFVSQIKELPAQLLARFTLIDYDRDLALLAVLKTKILASDGTVESIEKIIGVSRFVSNPDQTSCEFALVVADSYSKKGIGLRLMQAIVQAARDKDFDLIEGLVLNGNHKMLKLVQKLGFTVRVFEADRDFKLVSLQLTD